jgi:pimeloyl-ACP methyl ester carboxylesterase
MKNHSGWANRLKKITLLAMALLFLTTAPAAAQPGPFEPTPCDAFDLGLPAFMLNGVTCGYLTVPELHRQPTGPTLKLAVVILNSTGDQPAPDPLMMAQGGPGGSTLDFVSMMFSSPIRDKRDIVLFDQRGTLNSQPNLLCPEVLDNTLATIEQPLTQTEQLATEIAAFAACHHRLLAEGINLAAFNSRENAADVESLRQALGYGPINLYGVSYGTLLAQHVMRNYPASLRTVTLDAVVPASVNPYPQVPLSQSRAFAGLFAACAATPTCAADYPGLEPRFFALVDNLNTAPARVPLIDAETGRRYQAVLDGYGLVDLFFQMLYATDLIPTLPKIIDDAEHGQYATLAAIWPLFAFDRTFSLGMFQSVICAEDVPYPLHSVNLAGVPPIIAATSGLQDEAQLALCDQWAVPHLDASVDEPVRSDIPTLLFSGQFDPITPPHFAEAVATYLPHSYAYVFPANGHGAAIPGTVCSNQILLDFLDHPQTAPTATCLAEEPATPHFLPVDTLTIGLLPVLLNLSAPALWQLAGLTGGGLAMLSAWLVWPLLLLIYRVRHKKLPVQPRLAWLERGLLLLVALLNALFLAGFTAAIIWTMVIDPSLSTLLVGLPGYTAPLFLLPPLLVLLTGLLVIAMVVNWWCRHWTVWGRIYATALTLLAVLSIAILISWGMLTVLL